MKISPLTDFGGLRHEVRYDYGVNRPDPDPEGYVTRNNRLMKVETYDIFENPEESFTAPETLALGGGGTQQARPAPPPPPEEVEILLSTSWYYYTEAGNVERVVTNVAGSQLYSATRLGYAQNGTAVTFAVGETWNWTGGAPDPTGYDVTYAREFRYDGARARYLVRKLDAQDFTKSDTIGIAIISTSNRSNTHASIGRNPGLGQAFIATSGWVGSIQIGPGRVRSNFPTSTMDPASEERQVNDLSGLATHRNVEV